MSRDPKYHFGGQIDYFQVKMTTFRANLTTFEVKMTTFKVKLTNGGPMGPIGLTGPV